MLIIDSHLDLAWNALQFNRNLLLSAYTIRARENNLRGGGPPKGVGLGTVAFPDLRRGRIALSFATLLARSTGTIVPDLDYPTPAQAYGAAQGQLAYYKALARQGDLRIIADRGALDEHMAEWQTWDAGAAPDDLAQAPLGIVLAMESADPILDPAQLEEYSAAGVRVIGPAHYGPGRYAGGTGTELGLTEIGVAFLAEMRRLGVILDLTHCSDPAFWEALERFDGPVLASHNNVRKLVPHQRQYSDEQIRAISARGGVIGAAFDVWMLQPGWIGGVSSNASTTLNTVVDHIDYICQLTGTARHAAIGSDLDGGYGREQSPADLDTIADLQQIGVLLAGRGYSEVDIAQIMYRNWWDLLRRAWS